jgi:AcrR family transcriptional regulator
MRISRTLSKHAEPLSPPPLSRRERHSAAVRQRLFDAAMQMFAERGFVKTTVEDITDAADVGKGTFFNYFHSKEELLNSFGETRIAKVQKALREAIEGHEPVKSAVRRLFFDLALEPTRTRELTRSMMLTMLSNENVREFACARLQQSGALTAKIFSLGQDRGEVRRDVRVSDLAQTFRESHFGAMLLWSLMPSARLNSTINRAFNHFWDGAAPAHPAEKKSGRR